MVKTTIFIQTQFSQIDFKWFICIYLFSFSLSPILFLLLFSAKPGETKFTVERFIAVEDVSVANRELDDKKNKQKVN